MDTNQWDEKFIKSQWRTTLNWLKVHRKDQTHTLYFEVVTNSQIHNLRPTTHDNEMIFFTNTCHLFWSWKNGSNFGILICVAWKVSHGFESVAWNLILIKSFFSKPPFFIMNKGLTRGGAAAKGPKGFGVSEILHLRNMSWFFWRRISPGPINLKGDFDPGDHFRHTYDSDQQEMAFCLYFYMMCACSHKLLCSVFH